MSVFRRLAVAALAVCAGRGQQSGVQRLKWNEAKRTASLEVFNPERPMERYRLSAVNRTVAVWQAYRTGSTVVVMGPMDGAIGEIVTLLEAGSGREQAEFLCYDAKPSDDGTKIAFRHFYPHFGTAEFSDKVQVMDLGRRIPDLAPDSTFHAPPEEAGTTVYPDVPAAAGQRRRIQDFVWGNGGSSLYFVERIERVLPGTVEQTGVCLVRVDLATPAPRVSRNCLSPQDTGDETATGLRVNDLRRNAAGELLLALEMEGQAVEEASRNFVVDPATLRISRASGADARAYLAIPWMVQKGQLIGFRPATRTDLLKAHENDVVGVKLTIGKEGEVETAELGAATPVDVANDLAGSITRWRFRPTIFNGVRTQVVTGFEVAIGSLWDPEWAAKE